MFTGLARVKHALGLEDTVDDTKDDDADRSRGRFSKHWIYEAYKLYKYNNSRSTSC